MPKVDLSEIPVRKGSSYPKQFRQSNGDTALRESQSIALGLTAFGANRTLLPPGAASSLRHYHTNEDELVVVLSGELVMLTNAGETPMRAGDIASFPKGVPDAHCFVNRSTALAVLLSIGDNHDDDSCLYPDIGMRVSALTGYVSSSTGEPFPE
jgi:uncharacterized cupin superfamily protein